MCRSLHSWNHAAAARLEFDMSEVRPWPSKLLATKEPLKMWYILHSRYRSHGHLARRKTGQYHRGSELPSGAAVEIDHK